MKNWRRDDWFEDTGLPWTNPSPNLRNMVAASVYPGIGAIEGTNISVGRGTDTPFEQIGAPWINGVALGAALNARAPAGIRFYPVTFTPATGAKLGGQVCQGVFMIVTDRDRLRPVRVGLEIASALSRLYGQQFRLEDAAYLFGALRIEQLYVVIFLESCLGALFDAAYPAYVPTLIGRGRLVAGCSCVTVLHGFSRSFGLS